jgi:hypothetical protein
MKYNSYDPTWHFDSRTVKPTTDTSASGSNNPSTGKPIQAQASKPITTNRASGFNRVFCLKSMIETCSFLIEEINIEIIKSRLGRTQIPSLPAIGPGSIQLLKDRGFQSARDFFDFNYPTAIRRKAINVPTFGPAKISIVDAWLNNVWADCNSEIERIRTECKYWESDFRAKLEQARIPSFECALTFYDRLNSVARKYGAGFLTESNFIRKYNAVLAKKL